jgi:hypothetical protein
MGNINSEGYPSHYIESNRFGIFNENDNDLLIMPGFQLPVQFGKHFHIEAGADVAIKRNFDESFLYQGYLNLEYGPLQMIAGRQEYTLGQYSEKLSSGSFLVSNNAKPIPRIGIGFYDWVEVPFTKGYLQVKGALNHGWLDNDRLDHSPYNKPFVHEKFVYIRTRNIPINPMVGIAHYAMYGGEKANGEKVGIDYWAVFFAQGSSRVGNEGEAINAAGEHLGIVDLAVNSKINSYDITAYYQYPINDMIGIEKNFSRNQDYFTGILVESEEKKIINGFTYEFIHTKQQYGEGIPDPIVDGRFISLSNPDDIEFLEDYYSSRGYPVSQLNSFNEWKSFLQAYINYGYLFGGRSDYYDNYLYTHVYHNRIIGTPLFQTKPELERMTNMPQDGDYIVNNRVFAHHFGFTGFIIPNLDYRLMITYTQNKGAWQEYGGRTKWEGVALDPDYQWFWRGEKNQWYTLMELNYTLPKLPSLQILMGLGYDFGDLDENIGVLFGVTYCSSYKFSK